MEIVRFKKPRTGASARGTKNVECELSLDMIAHSPMLDNRVKGLRTTGALAVRPLFATRRRHMRFALVTKAQKMFKKLDDFFTGVATTIANASGQPATFVLALFTVIVWAASGPAFAYSETWQLVINTGTTIITFLMVFLIQNSQNRDTASMQAKLDELLYALEGAREQFIGIEHLSVSEVEEIRSGLEKEVCNDKRAKANAAVAKLISRL